MARRRGGLRHLERGDEVRGAGAGGDQDNARFATGAGVTLRHVASALLVACEDELTTLPSRACKVLESAGAGSARRGDLDVEEGIVDRQDGTARVAEDGLDTVVGHEVDKDLSPRHADVLVGGGGLALQVTRRRRRDYLAINRLRVLVVAIFFVG